ncbi:MAG: hypothetical protein KAJ30_02210 [Candidatus Heimdallarchaeota archaeon]|nr:hypothetical protein [Candidatus Heimdallarchaeota archaeon]
MTMWNVQRQHSKLYLIVIGSIYVLLVASIMVLAAIANDWLFWIFASLTNIAIIAIGVKRFIKLMKPRVVSPPMGKTLSYDPTALENEAEIGKTEGNEDGKNK